MNKKKLDLHVNSVASGDGKSVEELILFAKECNLDTIAITDRDISLAYENFPYNLLKENSINIVPGIELTSRINSGTLHILGYGLNFKSEQLKKMIEEKKSRNIYSMLAIILALKQNYNITIPLEAINMLIAKNSNIERIDIAKILVEMGIVNTIEDAFTNYLEKLKNQAKQTFPELTSRECISAIRNAGGIPVLAHPKALNLSVSELSTYVEDLIDEGLMGIEIYNSSYSEYENYLYQNLANNYGLITTGRSDFQGMKIKPKVNLSSEKYNNICVLNTNTTLLEYLTRDENNFLYYK